MNQKKNFLSILQFWRDVEIFNIPKAPSNEDKSETVKVTTLKQGDILPWALDNPKRLSNDANYVWRHGVFLGVADTECWAQIALQMIMPDRDLSRAELERLNGRGWLAAFVVDEIGKPVADTFVPASFALGLARLQQEKDLDKLNEDIVRARSGFDERLHTLPATAQDEGGEDASPSPTLEAQQCTIVDWPTLREEMRLALAPLGAAAANIPWTVVIKSIRRRRQAIQDGRDTEIEFLNSFYLNDLDRLIGMAQAGEPFGAALATYLTEPDQGADRRDVLTDHVAMATCLRPEKLPAGRWPAKSAHHLMLAQQAAVFEIVSRLSSSAGLVAVNGPPGTGKTTLLCDVIADVVVQRAERLAVLNSPWQAFEKKITVGGINVFPLNSGIVAGTGIVVTSNNNTAVENITCELPALEKICVKEFSHASYFQEVAANVFKEAKIDAPAWGLVAAALGNSGNRRKFANGLFLDYNNAEFESGRPVNIKPILEQWAGEDGQAGWENAKQSFLKLKDEFVKTRKLFIEWQARLDRLVPLQRELASAQRTIQQHQIAFEQLSERWVERLVAVEQDLQQATTHLKAAKDRKLSAELDAQSATDRLKNIETQDMPPSWARWLEMLGLRTVRVKRWQGAIALARSQRAKASDALRAALADLLTIEQNRQLAKRRLAEMQQGKEREKRELQHAIEAAKARVGEIKKALDDILAQLQQATESCVPLPDMALFQQSDERRHLSHVWVDEKLDQLRARLFLAALQLHEWTIRACAGKYIANLRAIRGMLLRETPEPLTSQDRQIVWQALFFLVPVVSTTLASFDRLFEGMGKESIGWLLIDEAGQATPQSIVGALWRSQRAVVIGDPLQIEPVLTVPQAIVAELRKHHEVINSWSPVIESAQTLADRTMDFGARIGSDRDGETSVWTGLPLRAHRRCIDPMFSVANTIAYAGQMVQANLEPSPFDCVLGESAWIDVCGTRYDGQVVKDELELLREKLNLLRKNWPNRADGKPAKVFIISPFRKVALEVQKLLKQLGLGKKNLLDCGTVHAFQGKEAEIVFIVLGSSPGEAGAGSRQWASSRPNLLNVALTRAKFKVYVIGSRDDWKRCRGFDVMASRLKAVSVSSERDMLGVI